jgi:hypothetical protein
MHPKLLFTLLVLSLAGCRKAAPPPTAPSPAPALQSTTLKVEVTTLPAGFIVATSPADALRLTSPDGGVMTITRGSGTDLPAAVRGEETRITGLPGGRFIGSIELLCQFGRAYLTRGRYPKDEEIRIFLVAAGRPLVLSYTYPATGSRRERLDQILAVLQNLQSLP